MKAKSTRQDLLTALSEGLTINEACKRARVSKSTYYRWLRVSGEEGAWAYQIKKALREGRISEVKLNAFNHAGDNSLYSLNRRSKMMHIQGASCGHVVHAYEDIKAKQVNKYSYHLCRAIADHYDQYLISLLEGPPEHLKQLNMFEPNLDETHDFYASTLLTHIALHALVSGFIQNMEEAEEFYRHYEKRGHEPHDIIHMMIKVFQYCTIWTDTRPNLIGVFDFTGFKGCLKEFQGLDIDRIMDDLAEMDLYNTSEEVH